ncbi:MAG: chitobiase/beta-hexosaminidase C-terminal domain-containing protein, partial [Bacteroidales bacterium]|nr:chitobiase/beta-hexosaminidase C-terminal domain-containing protein [Bacteroidales bacterium]
MKKFYLLLTLLLVAFVGRATEVTWTKVTDASVLKAGYKVIIVCESKNDAMSNAQGSSTSNRGTATYTINEGRLIPSDAVQIITLEDADGGFYFNLGEGKYLASTGDKKLSVTTTKDNSTIWTISIANGNATMQSGKSATVKSYIQHNSSSNLYTTYASNQTKVQLYYLPASTAEECAAPVFSVEGGTFYGNKGETKDVKLSCITDGATIKYTVNGGAEQTYNGTNIPELVFPGTYEVTAWATKDGLDNSATATKNYELVDVATLDLYTKVTDASVLKAGDKVIIVCESKNDAMSNAQGSSTSNRGTATYVTEEGGLIPSNAVQIITLEDAAGGFYLSLGNGNYLASTASKKLSVSTTKNNQTIWTISVAADGVASIHCIANTNAKSRIERNNSSNYYTVYDSTQTGVQLYYLPAPAAEECAAPIFSVEEGTHYGFNAETKQVTLSCSTEGATIKYAINDGELLTYDAPITITCPSTTKISAYAMMEDGSLADSQLIDKTYNYVTYPTVANIAEFKTQGAADATKPYMFTCPLTVTYQKGTRLYLRDADGDAILVYGAIDKTYEAGNQLPANAIVGTYTTYNQMAEIKPVAGVTWPESNGTADASPIEMTIAQLNAVTEAEQWSTLASKLVVIKGAKVSADGATITVGEESFTPAIAYRFEPELTNANCVYDIVGIIETHWNKTTKAVDGIQFCQTAYLDNHSPEKMYMIGYIQSINQDWNPTQGIEMAKEAAGRYSADVNLTFNDWFAVTSRIANDDNEGGWAWVNGDRYAYTSGVFGKVATDYVMTQ